MSLLDEFNAIIKAQEPLAARTALKVGGAAQFLAQPRTRDELITLIRRCERDKLSWRVLGGGTHLLVRDEGVPGLVIRLTEAPFTTIEINGSTVRAGGGAPVAELIAQATRAGLAGVEGLIGLSGTVGGALRTNAGSRSGYVDQFVRRVELLDAHGQVHLRERDELTFGALGNSFEDQLVLNAEFTLEPDAPDGILKRLRKIWIHKKAQQPFTFQASARLFQDPRGLAADQLIDQAGLKGTRIGGAEISDRNANYVIANPGATARDVLRLIEQIRTKVAESFGQTLQLELVVW
jgi:UDP-N-acetylmuramate dehydrogenase